MNAVVSTARVARRMINYKVLLAIQPHNLFNFKGADLLEGVSGSFPHPRIPPKKLTPPKR